MQNFQKFVIFSGFLCLPMIAFADAPKCPNFSELTLTPTEAISKTDECIKARTNGTANAIDEYLCPSGDFGYEDNRPLTRDQLAYNITVNLLLNESDKKMREYMEQLNKIRDKDPVAWTEAYGSCILGKGWETKKSLAYFYDNLCGFTFVPSFLNSEKPEQPFFTSSDAFPQTICQQLIERKKNAWMNLGETLMQRGITKSYQNDKDYFVEELQGRYRAILEKFHIYQKIIARASSKITHFIREAVK